jgi:hypothetical protein
MVPHNGSGEGSFLGIQRQMPESVINGRSPLVAGLKMWATTARVR